MPRMLSDLSLYFLEEEIEGERYKAHREATLSCELPQWSVSSVIFTEDDLPHRFMRVCAPADTCLDRCLTSDSPTLIYSPGRSKVEPVWRHSVEVHPWETLGQPKCCS